MSLCPGTLSCLDLPTVHNVCLLDERADLLQCQLADPGPSPPVTTRMLQSGPERELPESFTNGPVSNGLRMGRYEPHPVGYRLRRCEEPTAGRSPVWCHRRPHTG